MGIILAILLFSAIIIIHELGHFLLAKANGIRVDEFSLGLGPTLFGKQFGETKFSVKLLPFGINSKIDRKREAGGGDKKAVGIELNQRNRNVELVSDILISCVEVM